MQTNEPGFVEWRISPRWIEILLGVASFVIFLLSHNVEDINQRLMVVGFSVVVLLVALIAWWWDSRVELVARWVLLLGVVGLVHSLAAWMGWTVSYALLCVPPLLAVAMVSIPAGAALALGESLGVIFFLAPSNPQSLLPVHLAIWLVFGLTALLASSVIKNMHWATDYFDKARLLLEEARGQRVKLEQALKDLEEANRQSTRLNRLAHNLLQEAEDARAAKAEFVANVSHELRTPLNMITGFAEMILQTPQTYARRLPPALLADLSVIQRNAEHLKELIDDVLDLSQIEANQMALMRELVDIKEVVYFAMNAVKPLYNLKKLFLEAEISDSLPLVYCDHTRIREVLLNLLSNAGRFTETGGVKIRVWSEGGSLFVSVKDTGPGIAEADQSKLFQSFQQVDGTIHRRYGGTGLGLAISKQFIELHQGKIWVESEPGRGTTFTFRIPIASAQETSRDYARWFHPYASYEERDHIPNLPKERDRQRFVIQENGNVLQRLFHRYKSNVDITISADIDEAFQIARENPTQALLVNSISVNHTLQAISNSDLLPKGTPVILCSIPGIQEASQMMNVADILVKPVSLDNLEKAFACLGFNSGTVLIVDDEPDALQLFGRMIASLPGKIRVLQARDGAEAIEVIEAMHPDLILLDLVMPNLDGFQLLTWRDDHPEFASIPVIIISARDPAGQPIVSSTLAVTIRGGISVRQMLTSIEALSQILSPAGSSAGLKLQEVHPE